jgi:murein DD-endopeptidase MepM/ murein hydrolase activator NlpD
MRIFFRSLILAILLLAIGAVLGPWLKNAVYAIRLGAMPAPAVRPVPVAGVKPSRLADTWGGVRSEGRRHEGIDIFARRGTPVLSATEGIVLSVGTNRLGGHVGNTGNAATTPSHLHYGIYTMAERSIPIPSCTPAR